MKLHPLSAVSRTARYGGNGLFLGFVLSTVSTSLDVLPFTVGIGAGVALALVGAAYGFATYARYEYELTEDTFDVGSGVFGRTEREIPYRRIQNVDVTRNLVHRIFGVAVVRIETAGGGSTEAVLSVVGDAEATRLQREIRSRRARTRETEDAGSETAVGDEGDATTTAEPSATTPPGSQRAPARGPGDPAAADERAPGDVGPTPDTDYAPGDADESDGLDGAERLFAISPRELLALALTRFRFASLPFVVFGIPLLDDLAIRVVLAVAAPLGGPATLNPATLTADEAIALVLAGVPLALVAAYVISAVVSVVEFYGFELGERGRDLVYERGLLRRYSGSIPTDKVQTVVISETLPMRWLGYAALSVRTAGYAGDTGNQSAVPLADRERAHELADRVIGYAEPTFERAPTVARRRYAVRYGLVLAAVLGGAYWLSTVLAGFTLWYLPLVLAPAVPVAAHLKWANRGYHLGEDHVVVRAGFWRRRTHVVPYYRLQTVTGEATVFQRRLDLATVVADTASSGSLSGSTPTAYDLDRETARSLQRSLRERLARHVEKSR